MKLQSHRERGQRRRVHPRHTHIHSGIEQRTRPTKYKVGRRKEQKDPGSPAGRARMLGKELTIGRGRVTLTLLCADEHGER